MGSGFGGDSNRYGFVDGGFMRGSGAFITGRSVAPLLLGSLAFFMISGCGLEYAQEKFSLKIGKDGSGEISIELLNLGSSHTKSRDRKKDLEDLKDAARSDKPILDAKKKGVAIKERRLEFVNYSLNGFVRATASKYRNIFKVFSNYELEIDDRIYITPKNGIVARATLSDGGKIVVRNNKYTFSWPRSTRDISFEAAYKIKGASFSHEYQKRYKNR